MYTTRDDAQVAADNSEWRWVYGFEAVIRGYVIGAFRPFLPGRRAIAVGGYEGDFTVLLAPFCTDLTVVDVFTSAVARPQACIGLNTDAIGTAYLGGCSELGVIHPDRCASVFPACTQGPKRHRSGAPEVFEAFDGAAQ